MNNQIPRKIQNDGNRSHSNQRYNRDGWNPSTTSSSWGGSNHRLAPNNNRANSHASSNRMEGPTHHGNTQEQFLGNINRGNDRSVRPRRIDNTPAWQVEEHNKKRKNVNSVVDNSNRTHLEEGGFGTFRHVKNSTNEKKEKTDMDVEPEEIDFDSLTVVEKIKRQIPDCDFTLLDEEIQYYEGMINHPDWLKSKDDAAKTALRETKEFMSDEGTRHEDEYVSDTSSDVPFSDEDDYEVTNKKINDRWNCTLEDIKYFLSSLKQNFGFDFGYHVLGENPDDEKNCWCPLSKQMKGWKKCNHLSFDHCTAKGRMLPHALLKHLEAKAIPSDTVLQNKCPYHFAAWKYLISLYSRVNGGIGSKHLYDPQSTNYKRALACEKQKQIKAMEIMQKENNKLRQKAKESNEKLAKMKQLEKTNKDLHKQVEEMEKVKERFKISQEKKQKLSDEQIKNYSDAIRMCLSSTEEAMGSMLQTNTLNKTNKQGCKGIHIKIRQQWNETIDRNTPFPLQELFDDTYKKFRDQKDTKTFLFNDLKTIIDGKISTNDTWKWMVEWNIDFVKGDGKKNVKILEKEDKAIDKGGPTREFLAQVWKQMGQLKISGESPEDDCFLQLFAEDTTYYTPQSDEFIKVKINNIINKKMPGEGSNKGKECMEDDLLHKVKCYYRALGRIMYRAISSGNSILETVLSPYYLNVVLRGMEPKDETYDLGSLLDDIFSATDNKSVMEYFKDIKKEDAKEHLQESFFDNKKIAIDALREGFTLNDSVGVMFQLKVTPADAVRQCLFEKSSFSADELIKLLVPDYEPLNHHHNSEVLRKRCEIFFERDLKSLIKERAVMTSTTKEENEDGMTCGEEFLRLFLCFCTGSHHIPYRTSFSISVEFNKGNKDDKEDGMDYGPNALPVAHTCQRTLKLPGDIYRSKEQFSKKLDQSMSVVGSFGMN